MEMPTGLEPVVPTLERRGVRPATLASKLAIGAELESAMPRLRGVVLEPLCIADQAFGASSRELRPPANKAGLTTTGYLHLSEIGAASRSRTEQAPKDSSFTGCTGSVPG